MKDVQELEEVKDTIEVVGMGKDGESQAEESADANPAAQKPQWDRFYAAVSEALQRLR